MFTAALDRGERQIYANAPAAIQICLSGQGI